MKLRQRAKSIKLDNVNPVRVKGHVTLTMTDVKTGKTETVADHNMQTNAIAEMLTNCGFTNRDNLTRDGLVEQLLGGVMLFDDDLDEDADLVYVPEGVHMVANGAVGTTNNDVPTELGSYSGTESGWQNDGSYIETFDWTTSQGNGTIAAICATNKEVGYGGVGNHTSQTCTDTLMTQTLIGTGITQYNIIGVPCKVSLEDSSCYAFDFKDYANGKATIRKYRLPLKKVNIKGTSTSLVILEETEISIPSTLVTFLTNACSYYSYTYYVQRAGYMFDTGSKLMIFSYPFTSTDVWGSNYTQYLWECDPTTGTITTTTLANTSGETLRGICCPKCIDENTVVFENGYIGTGMFSGVNFDHTTLYSMRRSNGTWGNIQKCNTNATLPYSDTSWIIQLNKKTSSLPSGKLFLLYIRPGGSTNKGIYAFDYANNALEATNNVNNANYNVNSTDHPLVHYRFMSGNSTDSSYSNPDKLEIYRRQNCIATIFNLNTPVVKTAEKTMKLIYKFTFDEEEEEENTNS